MKIILKEGEKNATVRKTFECTDCGCIFTSDKCKTSPGYDYASIRFHCTCPWCHSDMAYEKKE